MSTLTHSGAKDVAEQHGAAVPDAYDNTTNDDDSYGDLDVASPEVATLRRLAFSSEGPHTIVELGVGAGRMLGALGRAVAGVDDVRLVGIDGSPDLLSRTAARYPDVPLDLVEADVSAPGLGEIVAPGTASLVFCVGASFAMLPDRAAQAATMRNIAAMLSETGVAMIETHSPAFVLDVIGPVPTAMFVPDERRETGLVCFSSVESGVWRTRQVWMDGDDITTVIEENLLTPPAELAELAYDAGLRVTGVSATVGGGEFVEPGSPLFAMTLVRASAGSRSGRIA